jgi:hypothetical protein
VKEASLLGQADTTGRALKQADAEFSFESGNSLSDRGSGQAEHATGRDETAEVGGADEGGQAAQAIHAISIRAFCSGMIGALMPFSSNYVETILHSSIDTRQVSTSRRKVLPGLRGYPLCSNGWNGE